MKWQVLMVGLATILALFLGSERWHARITAGSAFSRNASDGHWALVYADQEGVKAIRAGSSSPETLHGFEKLPLSGVGGFDVTPDLQRMAFVDLSNYAEPSLRVVNARHVEKSIASIAGAAGQQMQCPLFDTDGSVLYLQNGASRGWQMERLRVPSPKSSHGDPVLWPSAIDPNDCPERSDDGTTFAWMGTDGMIHLAKRDAAGNFSAEQKTNGTEFELAADGSFLVTFDSTNLTSVDTTTLARTTIASGVRGNRTVAISPDSSWVVASTTGGYGSGGWSAFRVRDGAEVPMSVEANSYYFGYDNRRKVWLAKP